MSEWREFKAEEFEEFEYPMLLDTRENWENWEERRKIIVNEARRLGIVKSSNSLRNLYVRVCAARAIESTNKAAKAFIDSVLLMVL